MSLSEEQIRMICKIRQEDPKASWTTIKNRLEWYSPVFKNFDIEEIKKIYFCSNVKLVQEPIDFWIANEDEHTMNINHYFYRHKGPGQSIKYGKWSQEEEELFIKLINKSIQDGSLSDDGSWGIFSVKVPFRVGYQCYNKYVELLRKQLVPRLPEKTHFEVSYKNRYAFSKHQEEVISKEIQKRIENGEGISIRDCQKILHDCYYDPHVMAKRAAELMAIRDGIQMYDNDGQKTNEFLDLYGYTFDLANNEPQLLLEEAAMPTFVASRHFVEEFMKRNNFSLRKPHVSRRGQLKVEEVDIFLKKLSTAIEQYGTDNVFNMDETSVRIAYYPDKVIGVTGSDEVHVDTTLNLKENFTAIMTCTRNKIYPPIILAKGKTDKCTNKFKINESNVIEHYVWRSDYGWTDEDVMKRYLSFLHNIHPEPCALVLDSFRAHITGNVLKTANDLGITIIQVPSNGTGKYQPLDRRIFGIVKSRLRKDLGRRNNGHTENRWSIALKCLLDAWSSITKDALASAWSIPGLQDENPFIPRDDNEFEFSIEAEN